MKITTQQLKRRANEILAECKRIAPEAFAGKPAISFRFSSRMTRSAGNARPHTGQIGLSTAYFADEDNFRDHFYNTVTHEIAHILSPPDARSSAHGPAWRAMHRRLGGNGKRTHSLTLAEGYRAKRASEAVPCGCGCGKTMQLGPTQYKRWKNGTRYTLAGHTLNWSGHTPNWNTISTSW